MESQEERSRSQREFGARTDITTGGQEKRPVRAPRVAGLSTTVGQCPLLPGGRPVAEGHPCGAWREAFKGWGPPTPGGGSQGQTRRSPEQVLG